MKTLLATLILLSVFPVMAQTSVIGLKSHHGNMNDLAASTDHFGEIMPVPIYDTIVKINENCVIQIGEDNGFGMAFRDTVCGHWYYNSVNYDVEKVQEYHGNQVKLIGFNEDGSSIQIKNNQFFRKRSQKQSMEWMLALVLLSGLGIYIRKTQTTYF